MSSEPRSSGAARLNGVAPLPSGFAPLQAPLAVGVYDNHTHLETVRHAADGTPMPALDPAEQLDLAASVGVLGVVQVGGDLESSRWSAALAERDPRVLAAVALHPNEVPDYAASGALDEALAEIDALAAEPRVRAIGETGLDFFRTGDDGRAAQLRSFEAHIEIAKARGLALQIHDRDAHAEVVETLLRVGAPERTVFHCFSGDAELAVLCAEHGWYLSFAGTVTFGNAGRLRDALSVTPLDRILIETDAPFLTPHPYRGLPNSAYLIPVTLRAMAAHLSADADELAAAIAATTLEVYGPWAPASSVS